MTLAARVVFGVLVVATLAAFVVTQHLKRSSPVLLRAGAYPGYFSPNGDGVREVTRISFSPKRTDEVSVSIVDSAGDVVRGLGERRARARQRLTFAWDGFTDAGGRAPDGTYRARIDLRGQGRSIEVPGPIVLDTKVPSPRIVRVRPGPRDGAPGVFPARGARAVGVRLRGITSRAPALLVYRVEGARVRLVLRLLGRPQLNLLSWDGRLHGRLAPAGTYLLAVRVSDLAGNAGTDPPRLPPRPSPFLLGHEIEIRPRTGSAGLGSLGRGAPALLLAEASRTVGPWAPR